MDAGEIAYLVSRLAIAAIATFLSILLWSRTRDLAWMLIVVGVISSYIEVVSGLLSKLGLIDEAKLSFAGFPWGRILLSNAPYVFLCAALLVMIRRKRLR
jgi:hypothetical protein